MLFGALVDGDGAAGHFEEDTGFLLFEFHFAEHGARLLASFFGLSVSVLCQRSCNVIDPVFKWEVFRFGERLIGGGEVVFFEESCEFLSLGDDEISLFLKFVVEGFEASLGAAVFG